MLDSPKHQHATHDFDGITENRENRPPAYFTVLFYGLILWGVAFSAYYLLSGWSSEQEFQRKMAAHEQTYQAQSAPTPPPAPPTSAAAAAAPAAALEKPALDAAALYGKHCAMCHGPGGKGGFAPDLTAASYKYGKTREAVSESIRAGRPAGMPGFANQLQASEIAALVDYLLGL